MDNQVVKVDILEKRSVLNKESLIDLAKIIQQLINATLEKKNKQQLQSLVQQLEVFKENVSEKFNAITNDQQQQQTPTSPSLEPNSNRIQTKLTTFNNNANYDRMEQDSPISNVNA
ncbi:unnamed protein product [Rotaria magnacalcarata]|nr:unnamed protein product [Rotaria magnacalcarata]CAF1668977.1 unnamed protein product [Rotaria magnacalcarata]CAF2047119.1 unnamed protein product [Rotaria magnacalcarata]CAF4777523.1 unnamed protein product [Rotaria magnacalcarata]CAF4876976.1 unnamed protein product [Rotaria magnacalcarata]